MKGGWIFERIRHQLRAAWDVLVGRAYAAYDAPDMMGEVRLRIAATPFAEHDWCDAALEDDNCQLTRHSGQITVGHWRALRAALDLQ